MSVTSGSILVSGPRGPSQNLRGWVGGVVDPTHVAWGQNRPNAEAGIDPRVPTKVAHWQNESGEAIPMVVTVQRLQQQQVADTLDIYTDSPVANISWGASNARFNADIDAVAGNAFSVHANSIDVTVTRGRNDTSSIYSVSLTPGFSQHRATRTILLGVTPAFTNIPVPPFAKSFQAFRSNFIDPLSLNLIGPDLVDQGLIEFGGTENTRPQYISNNIRFLRTGITVYTSLTVIFYIEN